MHFELTKWVRYEPLLPGNAEAKPEDRLYLEVLSGLTTVQLATLAEQYQAATDITAKTELTAEQRVAPVAEALRGAVRWPDGATHSVAGSLVDSLPSLLAVMVPFRPLWVLVMGDLARRIARLNSVEGVEELFFGRPSGGSSGTAEQRTASVENQPAAR